MKKLKIVLWFLLVVFIAGLSQYIRNGKPAADIAMGLALILIVALSLWFVYRKPKAKPKAPADSTSTSSTRRTGSASSYKPSLPAEHKRVLKVAGVTFNNDDGSSRQALLKKLYFRDAPFDDYTQISFEQFFWQDEIAFKVLADGYCIGNVAKKDIDFINIHELDLLVEDIEVVGGVAPSGEHINYGCNIRVSYLE